MLENGIQALLVENGVELKEGEKNKLLSPLHGLDFIRKKELSTTSMAIIAGEMDLLWTLIRKKEEVVQEILHTGEGLQEQVELLITIRGITPLTALAFLSDVGDISRFKSVRKMDAYLGLVPQCSDSGGKVRHGHITRESCKLTRTILTQSLVQVVDASPQFRQFYNQLKERRGAGRARIALIRKLCGVMRQMLISGEEYRNKEDEFFNKKRAQYRRILANGKGEGKVFRKIA